MNEMIERVKAAILKALRQSDPEAYIVDTNMNNKTIVDGSFDLDAVATAAASALDWQPISTAPRDGTDIFLGVDIATVWIVRSGWWDDGETYELRGYKSADEIRGWWSYRSSVTSELLCGLYEPTHWAFMPEPPAAT